MRHMMATRIPDHDKYKPWRFERFAETAARTV
jgi:hypothetical protein